MFLLAVTLTIVSYKVYEGSSFKPLKIRHYFKIGENKIYIYSIIIGFSLLLVVDFFVYKGWRGVLVEGGKNLLGEAHGLFFDILIFGIIITIYHTINSRKQKITQLRNEIRMYWGWKTEEGVLRTTEVIKRLSEMGETNIQLNFCYLKEANLYEINLEKALMIGVNLESAMLRKTNLKSATLVSARLSKVNLSYANLEDTNLECAILRNANLRGTMIKGCNLKWADLEGATVFEEDWIELLDEWNVKGANSINEEYKLEFCGSYIKSKPNKEKIPYYKFVKKSEDNQT